MVEVINGPVQLLPGLGVGVPSIVTDFRDEVHATGMHNNVIVLNEVNPVVDAVFPLAGLTDTFQPQFPQTVNRLRFSRISRDFLFQIAHSPHFIRYCFVAHAGFIHFIKDPDGFARLVNEPAEQGRRVIRISKVKTKGRPDPIDCFDILDAERLFFPILIDKTVHNTPVTKTCHLITAWILPLHGFKDLQVSSIQPFITQVIGSHGKDFIIRRVKKPLFYPVMFIPRVQCQGDLLEKPRTSWDGSTDGFIQHIKIIF